MTGFTDILGYIVADTDPYNELHIQPGVFATYDAALARVGYLRDAELARGYRGPGHHHIYQVRGPGDE